MPEAKVKSASPHNLTQPSEISYAAKLHSTLGNFDLDKSTFRIQVKSTLTIQYNGQGTHPFDDYSDFIATADFSHCSEPRRSEVRLQKSSDDSTHKQTERWTSTRQSREHAAEDIIRNHIGEGISTGANQNIRADSNIRRVGALGPRAWEGTTTSSRRTVAVELSTLLWCSSWFPSLVGDSQAISSRERSADSHPAVTGKYGTRYEQTDYPR